ncbi:MAG: class I SAM-dependent methyltransferase [bacterium]|nr:class I SAM-dependent methyltransferase [bacterium]
MNPIKKGNSREFYENFHKKQRFPWISRAMQAERLSVISKLIQRFSTDRHARNVLLVGCGSGDDMSLDPNAFGIDLSMKSLGNTKTRFSSSRVLQGDAQVLPFIENSFDLIICSEVIEHLPHRELFLSEAHRVLKKGGILILTTPNWMSWYGLARRLAEALTARPITAAGQPIDHWSTIRSLKAEMTSKFDLTATKGIWFYPPMGKGHMVLPFPLSALVYYLLLPVERVLQIILPSWGHMIAMVARKHQNKSDTALS